MRSPLTLAALSTVAVPGIDVYDVAGRSHEGASFDEALVIDSEQGRWIVRSPSNASAGAMLEAEIALLESLVPHVASGHLTFAVPEPAGFAPLPEGGRALVYRELPGQPLDAEALRPGPGLAANIGRALASLHELPTELAEHAGIPSYTAAEYRDRQLAELDEAAKTGRVPAGLLRRWEASLENVALWKFHPTIVHGDLNSEALLVDRGNVSAIVSWGDCRVADPADDLSWLLVAAPPEAVESILESYRVHRTELSDQHLVERAGLVSELALARWLLHGVRNGLDEVVHDAVEMLLDLDEAVNSEPDDA